MTVTSDIYFDRASGTEQRHTEFDAAVRPVIAFGDTKATAQIPWSHSSSKQEGHDGLVPQL